MAIEQINDKLLSWASILEDQARSQAIATSELPFIRPHVAIKVAQKQCARWHIQLPHKDLAYLPEGDQEFWAYIRDLRWAQAFARENRAEMVDRIVACMAEWTGGEITAEETISTHHNYTEQERHFGQQVWLTRKGAINAEEGRRGLADAMKGIEWRSENADMFLDEIPDAYKSIDQVMLDATDLITVDHELRQLLNVKGN